VANQTNKTPELDTIRDSLKFYSEKSKFIEDACTRVDLSEMDEATLKIVNKEKVIFSVAQEIFNDTLAMEHGLEIQQLTFTIKSNLFRDNTRPRIKRRPS